MRCIVSCEHASNMVPLSYDHLFSGRKDVLATHLAYDPGAAGVARLLGEALSTICFEGKVTRLLIDLNRSESNRRSLFSRFSSGLSLAEQEELVNHIYAPYRRQVADAIAELIDSGNTVLHLSVHSFTPIKNRITRNAHLGLLYDPGRPAEKEICIQLQRFIRQESPSIKVRRNYPYLGKSDGLITALRREFSKQRYVGVEIEMNQALLPESSPAWQQLSTFLCRGFLHIIAKR